MRILAKIILLSLTLYLVDAEHSIEFDKSVHMHVAITSDIGNIDQRHACRSTWLRWIKNLKNKSSYSFLVELAVTDLERVQIKEEAEAFRDVVVVAAPVPRDKSLASCHLKRWETLVHEFNNYQQSIDYYVLTNDESFLCIRHLLFNSNFWPIGQRAHISHFKHGASDDINIYSSLLVKDALQVLSADRAYSNRPLHDMVLSGAIKNVTSINDARLATGVSRSGKGRYNDLLHGWLDLLNATDKSIICDEVLSLKHVRPPVMIDLWNYMEVRPSPGVFTKPVLSKIV